MKGGFAQRYGLAAQPPSADPRPKHRADRGGCGSKSKRTLSEDKLPLLTRPSEMAGEGQYNGEWGSQALGHRELLVAANTETLRMGRQGCTPPPRTLEAEHPPGGGKDLKDGGGRWERRGRETQA